jgi:hypothetical protein
VTVAFDFSWCDVARLEDTDNITSGVELHPTSDGGGVPQENTGQYTEKSANSGRVLDFIAWLYKGRTCDALGGRANLCAKLC